MSTETNWDATEFFRSLTATNRLAQQQHFCFCRVSGTADFQELLERSQSHTAFVCVDDISEGFIELNNSPRTRRVKSVFFAMRYPIDKPEMRAQRMETMRELFRQFMSRLILEDTKLKERQLYLDTRIRFSEIPEYFASGCACARFQIAVDLFTDLRLNPSEWFTPGQESQEQPNTQQP